MHFIAQLVVVDLVVSLEGDAIDDRIFRDLDHQGRALHLDHHIREQARPEQGLQGTVGGSGIVGLTFLELKVGPDGLALGSDIALYLNSRNRAPSSSTALGVRRGGECEY